MEQESLAAPAITASSATPVLSYWRIAAAQVLGILGMLFVLWLISKYFLGYFYDTARLITPLFDWISENKEDIDFLSIYILTFSCGTPVFAVMQLWVVKGWVRWPVGWIALTFLPILILLPVAFFLFLIQIMKSPLNDLPYFPFRVRDFMMYIGVGMITSVLSFAPCGALLGLIQSACMRAARLRWIAGSILTWTLPPFLILLIDYLSR